MSYRDELEALRVKNARLESELEALRNSGDGKLSRRVERLERELAQARAASDIESFDDDRAWAIAAFAKNHKRVSARLLVGLFVMTPTVLGLMTLDKGFGLLFLPVWVGVLLWARHALRCPYCGEVPSRDVQTLRRDRCQRCDTLLRRRASAHATPGGSKG